MLSYEKWKESLCTLSLWQLNNRPCGAIILYRPERIVNHNPTTNNHNNLHFDFELFKYHCLYIVVIYISVSLSVDGELLSA